jgi:hypothetical protein
MVTTWTSHYRPVRRCSAWNGGSQFIKNKHQQFYTTSLEHHGWRINQHLHCAYAAAALQLYILLPGATAGAAAARSWQQMMSAAGQQKGCQQEHLSPMLDVYNSKLPGADTQHLSNAAGRHVLACAGVHMCQSKRNTAAAVHLGTTSHVYSIVSSKN